MFMEGGEMVWCDEPEAEAFGLYLVDDTELGWIADFADYGIGLEFSERYAEENGLVLVDRVRSITSKLP